RRRRGPLTLWLCAAENYDVAMAAILRTLPIVILGVLLLAGIAAGTAFLLRQLNLLPPDTLTIAAGARESAYYESALAYKRILARDEIDLEIVETAGSVANAALLADAGVDIALVQGGVPLAEDLRGLAGVRVEPVWVFTAPGISAAPHDWSDLRIAAGADGSGTRLIADGLLEITGAQVLSREHSLAMGSADAAQALAAGDLDVALFVAPAEAAYLRPLLASEDVELQSLPHSEAIALRLSGARIVRMPSGILDYARPLPEQDTELVALVTRLVGQKDLHPALVNRLVHAVLEVHSGGKIIPADRQYPSSADLGLQPDDYAAQLLANGFSSLERILPYWIVAQLNRVLLVLLPALLLLLPLMRMLPALYKGILNRRVFRHYARVHAIDEELLRGGASLGVAQIEELREELAAIEKKVQAESLPNAYRKTAYTLLHHLEYVRDRCDEMLRKAA
ncbi:MAG: TAXI family TRAP transporter solute-binding subunit, partial [Halieaceae bacterium]|nr:TAXI family TRAP transporter solute-binding subunit [Halieaceae bacterium]